MIKRRAMMGRVLLAIAGLTLAGCSANGDATKDPNDDTARSTATTPTTATSTASASIADTADPMVLTSASASPAAHSAAGPFTCLMWRVCGCNHGCNGVQVAAKDLKPGMKVKVVSGTEKGREVFVAKAPQAGGGETLVLGRDAPGGIGVCQAERPSNLLGYGCTASQSGDVPVNACAAGCTP